MRPFRFLETWISNATCFGVVKFAWEGVIHRGMAGHII